MIQIDMIQVSIYINFNFHEISCKVLAFGFKGQGAEGGWAGSVSKYSMMNLYI